MSAASCLLTESQFLCSICLDVFTDPVTIPCGHNFCKACITENWDINVLYECPNCKEVFSTRPELKVNTCISEMAAQFRQSAKQTSAKVPWNVFPGTKLNALMFCLVFPMCVCMLSAVFVHMSTHNVLVHKTHDVVPLTEEYIEKMAECRKTEGKILKLIMKRQMKIQEMRRSVELSNEGADREIADGVQVFTALRECVERSQAELIHTVKEKQRETEKQAEGFIKELEQEISELEKKSTEVEQPINTALPTKDWAGISVRPPSYDGTVMRAVNQLEEKLSKQINNLKDKAELKKVQQYAVDVTLDPDTANPSLILSDDGKQVKHGDIWKNLPDNPERFDNCGCLLSKQSFSSGRFYYEVQVNGKSKWTLGVARESINRKGPIRVSPQNGYWMMWLRNDNEYSACSDPSVPLSLKSRPQKVGVFVDYEEGRVSFYDVDAAALVCEFTGGSFTEKLYPFFSPGLHDGGKNSAPLIISPVNHTE